MDQRKVADQLDELATYLAVSGANPFKTRAMARGARVIREASGFAQLLADRALESLDGVGKGIAQQIYALHDSGVMPELAALRESVPLGLVEMAQVSGLGTKTVRQIHKALGIASLSALRSACDDGSLATVKGVGDKLIEKIRAGIDVIERSAGKWLCLDALASAERVCAALRALSVVDDVQIVGALARRCPIVESIELVVLTRDEAAVQSCVDACAVSQPVRVVCVDADAYAGACFAQSCAREHYDACVQRAAALSVTIDQLPAREVYDALDASYICPELREDGAVLQRAVAGVLPAPLESEMVRGVLHCHTTYSDGQHSLAQMRDAAVAYGWQYLGVSDHSQSAGYAGGLSSERVTQQADAIAALNAEGHAVQLLHGIESDILGDGALDYTDDILAAFDYVIASIHGQFQMSQSEMTARVCRALRHPAVRIFAHPTGRLLLRREGYAIDMDEVLRVAAGENVAVEINCAPKRAELDWAMAELAQRHKVCTLISPDAHSVDALAYYRFGVSLANKGAWDAESVINTWDVERLRAWLRN